MQIITISGNLGRDAEMRQAGNDQVCSFSVGVKQGYGDRASSNWFRCNMWGKRGANLAQYLVKGTKVVVTGELTIGEYQDKPQYDVRVSDVEMMSKGEARNPALGNASRGGNTGTEYAPAADDLDDDVPF